MLLCWCWSVRFPPQTPLGHIWALIWLEGRRSVVSTAVWKQCCVAQSFDQLTGLVYQILLHIAGFTHCAQISLWFARVFVFRGIVYRCILYYCNILLRWTVPCSCGDCLLILFVINSFVAAIKLQATQLWLLWQGTEGGPGMMLWQCWLGHQTVNNIASVCDDL